MLILNHKRWHQALLCFTLLVSFIYSLPNYYQDTPVVTIDVSKENISQLVKAHALIKELAKQPEYGIQAAEYSNPQQYVIRFSNVDKQMQLKDYLQGKLGSSCQLSLSLLPSTPKWLRYLGAAPMKLGLDLRGGVHLLLHVDASRAAVPARSDDSTKILKQLRNNSIRYLQAEIKQATQTIQLTFDSRDELLQAQKLLSQDPKLGLTVDGLRMQIVSKNQNYNSHLEYVIQKTLESVQKRVNELGLSEAIVQRQGDQHISVELPGIQDINKAKSILGNTATLRFHLVANASTEPKNTLAVKNSGQAYQVEKDVILSGDAITYASASNQDGSPQVEVQLGGGGESLFHQATRDNVGRALAIIMYETISSKQPGTATVKRKEISRVISAPRINQPLHNRFVITGLQSFEEADTLALLLRSGSLAAPIDIDQETTIGPSLGAENIHNGLVSIAVGLVAIVAFMTAYYRSFGLIANIGLVFNILMMVCLLSWLDATMTLPAMAAVVLSVGMAVDANVLINERIREELRLGRSDSQAVSLGYEKAFATILDANVTTLIVSAVLYGLSSGMIKGFAVTLIIGLLVSMFSSVYVTRIITWSLFNRLGNIKAAVGL